MTKQSVAQFSDVCEDENINIRIKIKTVTAWD